MTESKKEEASVAKTQKKSAISDDFGSDFLSSWKSMSVTEDDGLDFNQEVLPKGKKNMFNFDKLDMDFSLDGDFGKKMSSFNVDMSDLDFSSPAKKPSKAKEGSTEESLDGKQGGKQRRFNLSFDFNELDNFDFDSNFMKGKSKSEKAADLKGFDSPRKPEKTPSAQHKPAASVDFPECSNADKTPVSQHLSTSKFEDLDGSGKFKANISSSSTSADFGISSQSHNTASPMKQTTVSTKEATQSSQRSDRTYSTERNMQNTIQGSSSQSFSMEGSLQEAALTQGEVCSSATEDKTSQEVAPDINLKGCDNESSQPVHISGQKNAENESKKMLEKKSDVRMRVTSGDDSMQGDMNINDSSAGDSAQKMLHGTVSAKETYVKSKIDFEVFRSEGKVHQPEKETVDIQREYSSKSVGTETQLNPSAPKKACSVSGEKTENVLHLADAKSKSKAPQPTKPKEIGIQSKHPSASIGADTQLNTQSTPKKAGSVSNRKDEKLHLGPLNARSEPKARLLVKEKESSTVQSKYFNKSVETETQLNSQSTSEKTRHVSNKRNDNMHSNPADLARQEHPAIDAEAGNHRINASKSQEWEVKKGAFVALGNGKNGDTKETSSRLPEKTVKSAAPQSLNSKLVSSISRIRNLKNNSVEGNRLPPLHTAKTTLEASSLKVSRLAAVSHPKALTTTKSPKISTVNIEKRILISPHTKRKTPEVPEPDPVMLPPLKRPTPSPNQCRGLEETSKRLNKKMVHSSPIPDVPQDESWKELQQVPLLMEDDGNIEKAEAHSKELEDICIMLKKRHDEAKELLVRAIVNNNKLLMLNHPIYVEKIRMVERFANLVLSPACQI